MKNGKHVLGPEAASAMAMKWIVLDWLRTAFIVLGFIASVRAISTWAPTISGPGANSLATR